MAKNQKSAPIEIPVWAIASIAVVALLLVGFFGWKSIAGRDGDPGPPKDVKPGMYDLRAEVAKMRGQREQGANTNAPR
jgi:hypothetical protein